MTKISLLKLVLVFFVILIIAGSSYAGWRIWKEIKEIENQAGEQLVIKHQSKDEPPVNETETSGIDTSDWKTYRNEEYGFEVRYPENLIIVNEKERTSPRLSFEVLFGDQDSKLRTPHPYYPLLIYVFKKMEVPEDALQRLQSGKSYIGNLLLPFPKDEDRGLGGYVYSFDNIERLTFGNLDVVFTTVMNPIGDTFSQAVIFRDDSIYGVLAVRSPIKNLTPKEYLKLILQGFKVINSKDTVWN